MFTAAALLTLAEKDKIKFDEPIGNRIKGLSPKVARTTPHHLLSNSAGVRDGERKFTFGAQNENEIVFVPGKNGKIRFIFQGLYGAKRVERGK